MSAPATTLPNRTNVRTQVALPLPARVLFGALRLGASLVPSLAARAAMRLFTRPRRYTRAEREMRVLEGATSFTVPTARGRLPAWRWGEGPTVLLVHGWEGRGSQLGAFVEPLVERGFSVVTFDAPAHGDAPGSQANLFAFAEAMSATATAVGSVHGVIAHSMGGAASLYALRSGLGAERVVVVAPANAALAIERFARFVGLPKHMVRRMEVLLERRFGAPLEHFAGPRLASELAVPALVVHDDDDRMVPWGDGAAIAEAWSGSALHTTSGLGHHRILRDPDVVARTVQFMACEA